ncbi:putative baseplate assembly protein [Streptomyces palmae]|uniref:Putative baseplate assembly protein n=1 Tax=Streptomyces palmae TaxID=1701085 RepID=A0A4Z0H068_9ACTN|nr:putative baseplate assembly protein [Streptomyces palmae]TGB03152.1 putative baseplate assembly protein [Streptomyces palmae]
MTGAPIDYTRVGYEALRAAMLELARERLPEWTDQSENDLGVLLIELFAYAADLTLYYQTRIAANLLPETADEPEALLPLLRLLGYEPLSPAPATVDLEIAFDKGIGLPVTVPARTRFSVTEPGGHQLTFENLAEVVITALPRADEDDLRRFHPLSVVEGVTVHDEPLGTSDGSGNQLYQLQKRPVIKDSIEVTVHEPAGATRWTEVPSLAASTPADRHFVSSRDALGHASVRFGDGVNGMAPPSTGALAAASITATYRIGGGPDGNVRADLSFAPSWPQIKQAVNPRPAAGGAAAEDLDRARSLAPRLFRTQERAVTLDDHVDLARRVPGVGKVKVETTNWNDITLYVAPTGRVAAPSELLKRDLLAYFERHRMATVNLSVVGPAPCDIYLGAVIRAQPYFARTAVKQAVEDTIGSYLAFDNVDFGGPIYLSRVYDLLQELEQVASLTVFKFSRDPRLPADIVTHPDVDPSGVITPLPNELPRPGYRDAPPPRTGGEHPGFDPATRQTIFTIIEGGIPSDDGAGAG